MSDTPETDEELAELGFGFYTMGGLPADAVKVEFASKLERERDDLREIFPKILEALESGACASTCSVDFLREIPREVRLVRQRLERERDTAKKSASHCLNQVGKVVLRIEEIKNERDEAVRSCHIWQQGHSKIVADRDELQNTVRVLRDDADVIVADRDHWRAEAERWRDCHHEIIADRDWLILELVEISSTADNCENTWDGLHKIAVIADNILNGRPLP